MRAKETRCGPSTLAEALREAANRGPSEGLWRLKRARQTIRHEKDRHNEVETVASSGNGLPGSGCTTDGGKRSPTQGSPKGSAKEQCSRKLHRCPPTVHNTTHGTGRITCRGRSVNPEHPA